MFELSHSPNQGLAHAHGQPTLTLGRTLALTLTLRRTLALITFLAGNRVRGMVRVRVRVSVRHYIPGRNYY